jgi:lysophospholipase L1-like esterase
VLSAGPLYLNPQTVTGLKNITSRRYGVLGLVTAAGTVILVCAAAEVVLRAIDFRYELRVHVIESTAPEAEEVRKGYTVDPYLTWVDNAYYTRMSEAKTRKIDIAFLGDSCTQFGTYDRALADLIRAKTGTALSEVRLGVAGWTTHQGLRQMERDIAALNPCLVTIYFGWNDHWLSIGLSDREVERVNRSLLGHIQSLRLGQLLLKSYVALIREQDLPVVRVGKDEFRENLVSMVRAAKSAGALPVLITAPTSHREGREPGYLAGRWISRLSDLVPLHQRYVSIVREVAIDEGVLLCDLAADLEGLESQDTRDACFYRDGIHLTGEGNAWVARRLFECLQGSTAASVCFANAEH